MPNKKGRQTAPAGKKEQKKKEHLFQYPTTFVLPAMAIRMARNCQSERDVRWYLNGIHVNDQEIIGTDGHRMFYTKYREGDCGWKPSDDVVSKGHLLGKGDHLTMNIKGTIPAKTETMEFHLTPFNQKLRANQPYIRTSATNRGGYALCLDVFGYTLGIVMVEVLTPADASNTGYVDYKKIVDGLTNRKIDSANLCKNPSGFEFGINPEYLASFADVLKGTGGKVTAWQGVKLSFTDTESLLLATFPGVEMRFMIGNFKLIIMPMRI